MRFAHFSREMSRTFFAVFDRPIAFPSSPIHEGQYHQAGLHDTSARVRIPISGVRDRASPNTEG
jgi:hypothetical protein